MIKNEYFTSLIIHATIDLVIFLTNLYPVCGIVKNDTVPEYRR